MCAELRVGTFGAVTRIFTKKNERNQQRQYLFIVLNLEFSDTIVEKYNGHDGRRKQRTSRGFRRHDTKGNCEARNYLEGTDELIRTNDVEEIKTTVKQTSKIMSKLSELV